MLGAPVATTFVPHLVPLDEGELVSCYVTPTAAGHAGRARRAARRRPTPASRSSTSSPTPPGVRDVRETNHCHVHGRVDPRTGKVIVFAAIDNLWKGTSSQAIQNLNLMFGRPETEGLD